MKSRREVGEVGGVRPPSRSPKPGAPGLETKGFSQAPTEDCGFESGGSTGLRLGLSDAERGRFEAANALIFDANGEECLMGLGRAESLDYLALSRRGLDNDDADFLRYIELGDRHAAALKKAGRGA